MKERADFHVHLGDRDNTDLIQEALEHQVNTLAVFDRSLVRTARLQSLMEEAAQAGITIIPGVESLVRLNHQGKETYLELVGLDFSLQHPQIFHYFDPRGEYYRDKHQTKVDFQKGFLEERGFSLDGTSISSQQWEVIKSGEVLDTAIRLCKIAAVDPNNRSLISSLTPDVETHLRKRPQDQSDPVAKYLYWAYFAPGQDGFRRWQPNFATVVEAIHQAAGVVILPHPSLKHSHEEIDPLDILDDLFTMGLDGVEGWDADLLNKNLARKVIRAGRLVLGGSGKDATYYQNRVLGKGEIDKQRMYIAPRRLQALRNYKLPRLRQARPGVGWPRV